MMRLALRTLRYRKGGFVATFVAVAFGAAIVMACGGLMETGIRSNIPAERYAAAPIVVTADQSHRWQAGDETESVPLTERVRLSSDLVATVRAVSGVTSAIPDISFPVVALDNGQPLPGSGSGHNWAAAGLAPYRLVAGTAPARAGDVVLDEATANRMNAKPGSKVSLLVRGSASTFTVRGIAAGPAGATFFTHAEASRLSRRPGQIDAIGVTVAPGTDLDGLRQAVDGRAVVLQGTDRGLAEHPEFTDRENLIALAGSLGGIAAMTMMFVVASTLTLSTQQRQRELALLRTIGTTPAQVRRMVLGEAMVVSLPAVLIGCLPGLALGRFLFDRLAAQGVTSPLITYSQGWIPLSAGAGAAVLAAIGAAVIAGRRAGKARPVEALTEAGLGRKWFTWTRLVAGLLFLSGGVALLIITAAVMSGPLASATAGPAVLCLAIGVALLGPAMTAAVLALVRWPVQAFAGVNGRLAVRNVTARTVAMSAAVMPVMLATGIATANLYMQTTQVDAAAKAFTDDLQADAVLVSTTGGLAPDLLDQVRRTPGVASASPYVRSLGVIDEPARGRNDDGWLLQGIGTDGTTKVTVASGSLKALTGRTVALPTKLAEKIDRQPGSTITMTLGDGARVDLRVVATFEAQRGYESLLLPAEFLAAHTTNGLAEQILIRTEPGAQPVFASLPPGVAVADRETLIKNNEEGLQTQAWVNYLLVGMIIAYTAVSVINTLASSTIRRRREFALQRLTGSTRLQVVRMMTTEGLLVAVAGLALGTAVALACLMPFAQSLSGSVLPSGPPWIYLGIVATALLLTLTATLLPTTLSLRSRPAEAAARIE
ncbi:ABC transporter permease [Kribbella deserti]|uniref:ABC transporter permease n=1 Tax=Kribbella deserti TaxID=1926257 RepID=A0ABV6QWE9_9ACTN